MAIQEIDSDPSLDGAAGAPDADATIWQNGAFVRLFSAAAISYVGSFVTRTALPLAAIYGLAAGPMELAAIRSFEFVGWLLIGLVAGAWVDRLRRRPVMIAADLGRAVILGSIPIAALAGRLGLLHLVVAAFLAAILSVFFDSASSAYLPSVVARARLVSANSALSASRSIAEFTGFGISGILVQILTAPVAIAVDAVSFIGSALLLATIRRPEPARPPAVDRESVVHEIREGIGVVAHHPILRALAISHAANHLLWGVFGATYLLFAADDIGLPAAAIGVIAAIGGLGSFFGAAVAARLVARLGAGRTMLLGAVGTAIFSSLIPLAPTGAVLIGGAILVTQQIVGDAFGTIYEVVEESVTQTIVHDRVLGRVNATVTFVTTTTALAGSIIGGVIGAAFGLRVAFVVGILGAVVAALVVWLSPVGRLGTVEEAAGPASA
ncbi:MAG TPA: MFS transporter [Candidatus Limnocylindrales bacterium]|nr:MFS transporter [Candidatus Limnocylindrales bacterium]